MKKEKKIGIIFTSETSLNKNKKYNKIKFSTKTLTLNAEHDGYANNSEEIMKFSRMMTEVVITTYELKCVFQTEIEKHTYSYELGNKFDGGSAIEWRHCYAFNAVEIPNYGFNRIHTGRTLDVTYLEQNCPNCDAFFWRSL